MRDRYSFPALLHYDVNGQVGVTFPDFPGCVTAGADEAEALREAKDALGLHLYGMERDGETIPAPTKLLDLQESPNTRSVLVDVWMPYIRSAVKEPSVKKTLTIPAWLDRAAEAAGVNYSKILQAALCEALNVPAIRT